MVEGVGHDIALGALLQRIVADLAGGVQRLLQVALFQKPFLGGEMPPDPGEAIGLELDADRHLVGLDLAHLLAHLVELRQHADQVLHVMAHLVGKNIGLREIARGAEAVRQFVIEIEVDIKLLVAGAVKRSGRRTRRAAGRAYRAGEQHQSRLGIVPALALHDAVPDVFGLGQHGGDELLHLVVALGGHLAGPTRRRGCRSLDQLHRIDAEHPEHDRGNDQEDDSAAAPASHANAARRKPHAAASERIAAALTPTILDISALTPASPFHRIRSAC